ncbi:hypothetical protein [Nocardia sp. NPDC051463]|uniref:hypothetical protein n=1 Tax=Nocardia sp. NPDC051463 TaxID=3154845 RepID=UPI003424FAC2
MKRIFDQLVDEHAMTDVSYRRVRDCVAMRRRESRIEAGRGPAEAFIRQTRRPAAEGEVDFGEVGVRLRGELVTVYLISLRLSFPGKAVHRAHAPVSSKRSSRAMCMLWKLRAGSAALIFEILPRLVRTARAATRQGNLAV